MEDEDEEVPTDEIIERMEERLEAAQNQQKRLFLIIFQVEDWTCTLSYQYCTHISTVLVLG